MKYLLIIVLFISCKADQFTIGMSEQDFLARNNVRMIKQSEQVSIYSKTRVPFGKEATIKFFYFRDGKLAEVNLGHRAPDIIIENIEFVNP